MKNTISKKQRTLGTLLKRRRQELDLTQTALAEKLEVSQNYIAYLELDQRVPSGDLVKKLAKTLSLDAEQLYFLAFPEAYDIVKPAANDEINDGLLLELKNNKSLRTRYEVTDDEIQMLDSIKARGRVKNIDDYLLLLMTLRRVYAE